MVAVAYAFDPLLFSNRLIEAGLPKPQADIIAEAQKEAFERQNQTVEEKVNSICATKEDLFRVETSLKEDMQQVEKSLREEIQQGDNFLKKEIDLLRHEFINQRWLLRGIMAFMVIFIVPMFLKMFFG